MPSFIGKLYVNNNTYDLKCIPEIPEEFKNFLFEGSAITYAYGQFGKVLYQQISLDNFEIWHSIYRIKEGCVFQFDSKKRYLGVHITLKNNFSYSISELGAIVFKEAQCNLFYLPLIHTSSNFQKDKEYVCFDVSYRADYVKQYAALFPFAKSFIAKLKNHTAFCVHQQPCNISFTIRAIVNAILNSNYHGDIQKAYLKVKVTELLFHIMALPSGKKDVLIKLNESVIDKLHEAKKFIEDNYAQHYSISKIARKYGMNVTSFKNGFHHEFGIGPFGFLVKIRMVKAIELVKENRLAINLIADLMGYKSFGSFIKAFKKRYDCTPGQMRNTTP